METNPNNLIKRLPNEVARNLKLVENGIYPIMYDKNNNILREFELDKTNTLETGFRIPGSIISEGKLFGNTCLNIKLSECNLNCSYEGSDGNGSTCDSVYSSHFPENNTMNINDISDIIKNNISNLTYLVVTGGEPLLQARRLNDLLIEVKMFTNCKIMLETNATIYIPEISKVVDFISLSIKLSNSNPTVKSIKNTGLLFNSNVLEKHNRQRLNIAVIQRYIDLCNSDKRLSKDFELKFVISDIDTDISELDDILSKLRNYNLNDVILIPEGTTSRDFSLNDKDKKIVELCLIRGFRYSTRFTSYLFGNGKRFV